MSFRTIILFVSVLVGVTFAKGNDCYRMGSNLISLFEGCVLDKSSMDYMDYDCYNGSVSIEKATGSMIFVMQDSRGQLTLWAGEEVCGVELVDEFGVSIIPLRKFPKGNNGRGLYKKFKKKFLTPSVSSVNSECPPSWQDSNGVCDTRYFE